ncbi:two-component sensor histidine kinase [Vibrio navarrensis]|nr:ATPase [Vibrio sp. S234-5]MBE4602502.1 two-component sensor histidine kinase [Vibrio navarrensis]
MRKMNTIGIKLVMAFASSTLLLTVVCLIAWTTWSGLDSRVSRLLHENVPRYNASYLLESRSSEARRRIEQIRRVNSKVDLDNQLQALISQLAQTQSIVGQLQTQQPLQNTQLDRLEDSYQQLTAATQKYAALISLRIDSQRQIDLLQEQLDWIHIDIRTELMPLRQEVDWQISRNTKQEQVRDLLTQLNSIQQVMDLETNVYDLVLDVTGASQLGHVNNGMKVIQYRSEELFQISQPLLDWSSSIAFQQLLNELNTLLRHRGSLHLQLLDNVALNGQITEQQREIEQVIADIHKQIGAMVAEADAAFHTVKSETTKVVKYGNQVLIACFTISILTSLLLAYYFIHRRIVVRLLSLSSSIDAIINDDLHHPIVVDGRDEIGRLSAKLIEYGDKVKEMQRTNALSLINNTSASLITTDLYGAVESANVSARRLLQLDDTITAQPLWAVFPSGCTEALQALFFRESELMSHCHIELTVLFDLNHQTQYLHCEFSLFTHGHSEKVIVTINDVTEQMLANRTLEQRVAEKTRDLIERNAELKLQVEERQRAERHLQKTQSELIQAAKMAVVGQAMTSLAHELNQPLNAMSTYLYSASMFNQQSQPQQVADSLHYIESLKERMSKIINGLRHFARKTDTAQPETLNNLHDVIEHAILLISSKAKRQQVSISNGIPNELCVWGNSVELEQVFINLLVNSCDALSEQQRQRCVTLLHLHTTRTRHMIAVADNGAGFDIGIVDKLFTPFTTTKEIGLGLGMNICQSIVKKHKGDIYLASALSGGAMVVLDLPYEH